MRELCDTRAPYSEFTKTSGHSCLPERLQMRGYATTAVHGFYAGMFERNRWYPRVGFENMDFGDKLMPTMTRRCGSAFRGICDADLPPVIERAAAGTKRPDFIYWLTLNIIFRSARQSAHQFQMRTAGQRFWHHPRLPDGHLSHEVLDSVAKLALNPDIGPAEILVVGDHAPPLWSKRGRSEFEAGKVPWYRLTPRDGGIASNGGTIRRRHTAKP